MGGSQSQEFMVYTDAGEDFIASCPVCGYAANLEKATSRLDAVGCRSERETAIRSWCQRPVAEQSPTWLRSSRYRRHRRSVAYMALEHGAKAKDGSRKDTWHGVATFLRDHQVNETKMLGAIGAASCAPCRPKNCSNTLTVLGSLGPVGLKHDAQPLGPPGRDCRSRPRRPQHGLRRDQLVTAEFGVDACRRHSQCERGGGVTQNMVVRASSSSAKPSKSGTSSSSVTNIPSPWARTCST